MGDGCEGVDGCGMFVRRRRRGRRRRGRRGRVELSSSRLEIRCVEEVPRPSISAQRCHSSAYIPAVTLGCQDPIHCKTPYQLKKTPLCQNPRIVSESRVTPKGKVSAKQNHCVVAFQLPERPTAGLER